MSLVRFNRYALIGVGNTLIHWLTFLLLHLQLGLSQGASNLLAFLLAASVSYFMNAHYTFAVRARTRRYVMFLTGMGCLSLALGAFSDFARLPPWLTLVTFSMVSLIVGYVFSYTVVFRRRDP
jgi:putative flippase GtrA